MTDIAAIQKALNAAGFGPVSTDGKMGPLTRNAIKRFQRSKGILADGIAGPKTQDFLFGTIHRTLPNRDEDAKKAPTHQTHGKKWPRQNEVEAFFGKPCGPDATAGKVILPVAMRYDNQPVRQFSCHKLVADPMLEIFKQTVEHYGEAEWRRLRLDQFGGCFNCRVMRGGSRYSMHAWGIAVDIDAANNQLKWNRARATLAKPEYEPFWKIVESQGAISLGRLRDFDWMHFQFARL